MSQQQAEQGKTEIQAALRRALVLINSEPGELNFLSPAQVLLANPYLQFLRMSRHGSSTSWSRSASANSSQPEVSGPFSQVLPFAPARLVSPLGLLSTGYHPTGKRARSRRVQFWTSRSDQERRLPLGLGR